MIPFPDKKYNIIYADPPWKHEFGVTSRGNANKHYQLMDLEDIKNLPVQQLADKDCFLFLWVPFPKLEEGLQVIKSWGFLYRTVAFTWIKTSKRNTFVWGIGYYTRSNAEPCLLAIKGKPRKFIKRRDISSIVVSTRTQHSKKPAIIPDKIVKLLGDIPRIELFARRKIHGWDSWGNEIPQLEPLESFI